MTSATDAALALLAREQAAERQLELENAIELAVASHQGQADKQGRPYILHCLRVMLIVSAIGADDLLPAAVIHDTVEDTGMTLEELPGHGMSARTVELVDILTRREDEEYAVYIGRVVMDRQASIIKVADLSDNINRLWLLPEAEATRLLTRYKAARERIQLLHGL